MISSINVFHIDFNLKFQFVSNRKSWFYKIYKFRIFHVIRQGVGFKNLLVVRMSLQLKSKCLNCDRSVRVQSVQLSCTNRDLQFLYTEDHFYFVFKSMTLVSHVKYYYDYYYFLSSAQFIRWIRMYINCILFNERETGWRADYDVNGSWKAVGCQWAVIIYSFSSWRGCKVHRWVLYAWADTVARVS